MDSQRKLFFSMGSRKKEMVGQKRFYALSPIVQIYYYAFTAERSYLSKRFQKVSFLSALSIVIAKTIGRSKHALMEMAP